MVVPDSIYRRECSLELTPHLLLTYHLPVCVWPEETVTCSERLLSPAGSRTPMMHGPSSVQAFKEFVPNRVLGIRILLLHEW